MAGSTAHIIPHKAMSYTQGMDAVFVIEIIGLILCPVGKVVRLVVCPDEGSFSLSVVQANPALGAIKAVLYKNILLLTANVD